MSSFLFNALWVTPAVASGWHLDSKQSGPDLKIGCDHIVMWS